MSPVDNMTANEREMHFREYACDFWNLLKNTFWVSASSLEHLPIVFIHPSTEIANKYIAGVTNVHLNTRTNTASMCPVIYLHNNRNIEDIQQTIRHEIIHYFLWTNYINHDDGDALFHILCNLFDAGAYVALSAEKQLLYDIALPYVKTVHSMVNESAEDSIPMTLSMMLTQIDDADHSISESSVKKLEQSLKLLVNVATAKHSVLRKGLS